jgi:ParB family chromosome partitioning protein
MLTRLGSRRILGVMVARKRTPRRGRGGSQPDTVAANPVATVAELREIRIDKVDVSTRPARRFLGDIAALAESMQEYGLQQPISVRASGDHFALTSGLRRLTAARMLRWATIPAFVRRVDEDQAYLLDLIENLQREDLSPEEEADALGELLRTRGWTLQQLADAIKRSVAYISKRIRVFDDPLMRQAVVERGLPVSTAEELLGADAEVRVALIERAVAERWDQTRARLELHTFAMSKLIGAELAADEPAAAERRRRHAEPVAPGRPRGLTRAIREFHHLIALVEPAQLTEADRSALRTLFRDLTMLARAPVEQRPRVFPPLPVTRPARRRSGSAKRAPRAAPSRT